MSAITPAPLEYRDPLRCLETQPPWAALARTLAIIAILTGGSAFASEAKVMHERNFGRYAYSLTYYPSSIVAYPPHSAIQPYAAQQIRSSIDLLAASGLIIGGILLLFGMTVGRAPLLIGLGWTTCIVVERCLVALMVEESAPARNEDYIQFAMVKAVPMVIFTILSAAILMRPVIFRPRSGTSGRR
jgi:hypothetical protein